MSKFASRLGRGPAAGRQPGARPFAPERTALAVAMVVGVGIFAWPFLGRGGPTGTAATALGLGTAAVLMAVELATRRLDARGLALLAALSALDAGARAASPEERPGEDADADHRRHREGRALGG